MKIRRIINDFLRFNFQLRGLWLLGIVLGGILTLIGFFLKECGASYEFLLYLGGAVIGLAGSAFFSRPEQFLLRASRDDVYLIENRFLKPRIHLLEDRETMNAFSGEWHKILHVSEPKMSRISKCFKGAAIKLEKAVLYQAENQNTVFAVPKGTDTRYGIPDSRTQERIWKPRHKPYEVPLEVIDRFLPGRDLVSERFWPPQDQSASHKEDVGTEEELDAARNDPSD